MSLWHKPPLPTADARESPTPVVFVTNKYPFCEPQT